MDLWTQAPLGWSIHGLHYWAAQAFIVVMGLRLARVFIWTTYKKPRELTWSFGVVLLLLLARSALSARGAKKQFPII